MNTSHITRPKSAALRWSLLFVLLVTALVVPFVLFEEQIEAFAISATNAAPGAASIAAMIVGALALDVVLPVPSSLVNAVAGASLGFVLGTAVCWVGMMLGCGLAYWIGATGGSALVRRMLGETELSRAARLAGRIGAPALIVMRAVPVLAEASTIAAGTARYPFARFAVVTGFANLGVAAAYAGIGAFAWSANSFLLAFAGAVGIPALAYGVLCLTSRGIDLPLLTTPEPETATPEFSITYRYPVAFTRGLFDIENPVLADALTADTPAKCLFLIDSGVADAHSRLIARIESYCTAHGLHLLAAPQTVPGGEAIKHGFDQIPDLYRLFLKTAVDRHAYVVAIGGGAVLDAVGFAAATAHRGIRHIRIPTTVLSQNDSGVGVKNAVNFDGIKNYAGTFAPPRAVLNDFDFLTALPRRERIAGIAEAVKVALIRDAAFFDWLEANADALTRFDADAEQHMIRHSAELHLQQITRGGDPFETGSARPLDFGHWSAHKLEALTDHALRHGEAVAIGIALDARYSMLTGLLSQGKDDRICALLDRLGLPTWHPVLTKIEDDGTPAILAGLREFREHLGGDLTITLLTGVGYEVHEMDPALVQDAMDWLNSRRQAA